MIVKCLVLFGIVVAHGFFAVVSANHLSPLNRMTIASCTKSLGPLPDFSPRSTLMAFHVVTVDARAEVAGP